MAVLTGRFQTRVAAWSLTGLILTAQVPLALNEGAMSANRIAAYGIIAVAVVVYAWVGSLITVCVTCNAIGWLLLVAGLSLAVSLLGEQYALRGLATSPGSLPAVRQVGAIASAAGSLALQNVAKYAHASAARVDLCHDGQRLVFTVEDDGLGFDQATTPVGTGLQGMSDRLAALGGTVGIASSPGHGTRVTGRIPAQAR